MRYILLYSLLFILANNLLSNAIPLGVSIGFASLPSPDMFGQQRVWGTVGFGIFAFVASRLFEFFRTEYVYIIMFCITSILCIIVTGFIRIKPTKIDVEEKENEDITIKNKKKKSHFDLSALIPLLKKVDVIIFLTLTFIFGMSYAGLDPVSKRENQ